jgi:hypothetical protein
MHSKFNKNSSKESIFDCKLINKVINKRNSKLPINTKKQIIILIK